MKTTASSSICFITLQKDIPREKAPSVYSPRPCINLNSKSTYSMWSQPLARIQSYKSNYISWGSLLFNKQLIESINHLKSSLVKIKNFQSTYIFLNSPPAILMSSILNVVDEWFFFTFTSSNNFSKFPLLSYLHPSKRGRVAHASVTRLYKRFPWNEMSLQCSIL